MINGAHTTKDVLANIEEMLAECKSFRIREVYNDLSIFDWWKETLSQSQLKDMRKFLKWALKNGYTGYCCFKVGASGCANGMWAYKMPSSAGYAPYGACVYKSFTPDCEYWQIKATDTSEFLPKDDEYRSITTIKQLNEFCKTLEV